MCAQAAVGVELQSKGEYRAANDEDVTPRAIQINSLISNELKNLPTNNLNCESYLAKFGYLAAQSAVHSNKLFKAKRIRDDLFISDAEDSLLVEWSMNKTMKIIDEMKISRSSNQRSWKRKDHWEYKKERKSFSAIFHFNGTNRNLVRSTSNACRYWSDFCSKLINSLRIQLSELLCMETTELVRVKLFFISFRQELKASLINFSRNTNSIRAL